MDSTITDGEAHSNQIAYWNGPGGAAWVAQQAHTDAMLAPVAAALIAHAAPQPGERVLDIGCGCGATSLALAERIGDGHVTGLDVSAPMLAVAAGRGSDPARLTWLCADAAAHAFPKAGFDLLTSRFGVMFFGDPTAAFANLRRAVRPGGRLAFACWRSPAENPWMAVPLAAAAPHLPESPPTDPTAPGPFAFADPARVTRILTAAGWSAPRLTPVDLLLDLAAGGGLDSAVAQMKQIGAAARALREQPPEVVQAALDAVRAALRPHVDGAAVRLRGGIWLVSADA